MMVYPGLPGSSTIHRLLRSRAVKLTAIILALACIAIIESLHDHECAGDACTLCLVISIAHTLLCLCVAALAAQSIYHALACVWLTDTDAFKRFAPFVQVPKISYRSKVLTLKTPLVMKVMLRI